MKDAFVLNFAIRYWLASQGLPPIVKSFLTRILTAIIGSLLDKGILKIDLTIDAIEMAKDSKEFRADAIAAYKTATARVYSDEEKAAIRKQYLEIARRFIPVERVRDRKNS